MTRPMFRIAAGLCVAAGLLAGLAAPGGSAVNQKCGPAGCPPKAVGGVHFTPQCGVIPNGCYCFLVHVPHPYWKKICP
jgi:hypothetical protein